jgi:hypothetical protein
VTRSQGEGGWQYFETAEAVYHFSTKGKKWVFKECFPRHGGRPLELKDEPLVTFAEVQAAFEQEPGERLAAEPGVAPDRRPLR